MKAISWEEYCELLNSWEGDKYVTRVPRGHKLVLTSKGKCFLVERKGEYLVKTKKNGRK